jgi:hypothetical protein
MTPAAGRSHCAVVSGRRLRGSTFPIPPVTTPVAHSDMAPPPRRAALRRFVSGQIQVISAPRLLDEGIDVPAADWQLSPGPATLVARWCSAWAGCYAGRLTAAEPVSPCSMWRRPSKTHTTALMKRSFDEVVDVAEQVRWFPAHLTARDPMAVCGYLDASSWGAVRPPPRVAPPGWSR